MGLFGDDKLQDQRLDSLEAHIRKLTETVQNIQADLAAGQIALMVVQLQLDEKISADEVDPTLIELNTKCKRMEEAKEAGEESWKMLESGASESFKKLGQSINQAFDRLKKK
jgi:uncharacterized protein (DUF342 family)